MIPDSMAQWRALGWCDDEPPSALKQLQLEAGWCANCMIDDDEAHTACAGREGFVCGCHECEHLPAVGIPVEEPST